jgi:hypothetical protein
MPSQTTTLRPVDEAIDVLGNIPLPSLAVSVLRLFCRSNEWMASRCAQANILGGHPRSDLRLRRCVVFKNDKAGVICEQTVKVSRFRGAFCLSFSRPKGSWPIRALILIKSF